CQSDLYRSERVLFPVTGRVYLSVERFWSSRFDPQCNRHTGTTLFYPGSDALRIHSRNLQLDVWDPLADDGLSLRVYAEHYPLDRHRGGRNGGTPEREQFLGGYSAARIAIPWTDLDLIRPGDRCHGLYGVGPRIRRGRGWRHDLRAHRRWI